MAPYCAIPRDYLREPPLARYGVFAVYAPPHKRGISAILARCHMKTRQMGADTPLCDNISKRYCAIWGGISHWADRFFRERRRHININNLSGDCPVGGGGVSRPGGQGSNVYVLYEEHKEHKHFVRVPGREDR